MIKYEMKENGVMIYDESGHSELIALDEVDRLKVDRLVNRGKQIDNNVYDLVFKKSDIKQVKHKSSVMAISGFGLTALWLILNNPLHLGLLILSCSAISLVSSLYLGDQVQKMDNIIKKKIDQRNIIFQDLKRIVNSYELPKDMDVNQDRVKARFISSDDKISSYDESKDEEKILVKKLF